MPFKVEIDHEQRLVESRWDGVADENSLFAYIDQIWGDPAVREYDELIDFRQVTEVRIDSSAVHQFAKYSRQYDNPKIRARSAVVAASDLVFGLSRMFSTVRSLDPEDKREFEVFSDFDVGRNWLVGK